MLRRGRITLLFLVAGFLAGPATATWSIVATNRVTKEVAIASATCGTGADLEKLNAVVRVGVGVGTVQAAGDRDNTRRPLMRREIINGTPSKRIVKYMLLFTSQSNVRQFGFAQGAGNVSSFTGEFNSDHASGVSGKVGNFSYAIQGNILTGRAVVEEAKRAFVNTSGPLPDRVMAAMEAARAMGGDGRCSCSPTDSEACGAPPASFDKAAHIGYMIVSRLGDKDGKHCDGDETGCANGDYYMNLNVPNQQAADLDPVLQMRNKFDSWRRSLRDRPDAIKSEVKIEAFQNRLEMKIDLYDWEDLPVTKKIRSVKVKHAPESAGATNIGRVVEVDNKTYTVSLTPNGRRGVDRFWISVDDRRRKVVLMPLPEIDDAACATKVKKTTAKNRGGKLFVEVTLKGSDKAGQEVGVKIVSRGHDPVSATLGLTGKSGKAKATFALPSDIYDVRVHSLTPSVPGGECLDPNRKKQKLVAKEIMIG